MKNAIIIAVIAMALSGCNNDDDHATADLKYYSLEIVRKDGSSVKYQLEDGRVAETLYKGKDSAEYTIVARYVYNDEGLLSSIEQRNARETFSYDEKNELTEAKYFMNGELLTATQYFHKSDGVLDYTVESIPGDTVNSVICKYVYDGGNPVQESRYMHSKKENTTTLMDINFREFDTRRNPYNALNLDFAIPRKNNEVEVYNSGSPEHKTITGYTYNESGYPTSFRITTNFDALFIEGEFIYQTIHN